MLGNDSEVKDPAARAEIDAVLADPKHPYNVRDHPGHEAAVGQVTNLYRRAYPEPPAETGPEVGRRSAPAQSTEATAARREIDAVLADQSHPFWKDDPAAVKRMGELYRTAGDAGEDAPAEKAGEAIPPPPDPSLAPVWHDPEFRDFTSEAGTLGMPAPEVSRWLQYAGRAMREAPPDPEAILETLRGEWGQDFHRNLLAARVATKRLGPAFKHFLNETALGDDQNVIRRMAQLGAPLLRVADEIDKIDSAGREHPFWDDRHPGHARAVQERTRLYRVLYGDR